DPERTNCSTPQQPEQDRVNRILYRLDPAPIYPLGHAPFEKPRTRAERQHETDAHHKPTRRSLTSVAQGVRLTQRSSVVRHHQSIPLGSHPSNASPNSVNPTMVASQSSFNAEALGERLDSCDARSSTMRRFEKL